MALVRYKSLIIFCILILSPIAYAEVPEESRCIECGMKVDPSSKFIAYITIKDGKKYFCDIGDMLYHLKKKKSEAREIFVKDYENDEFIDGKGACYVSSKEFKTPMGWNIAAFGDFSACKKYGEGKDFGGAFDLLK